MRDLLAELRKVAGHPKAPIFIDQEGGSVARLKPPHWPKLPSMRTIGRIYEKDSASGLKAMQLHARLTAQTLSDLGIICNLAPVLDLCVEGASSVIGDRAFCASSQVITALGRVAIDTSLQNGVLPCIKHLPGHGRMKVDPHFMETIVETPEEILRAEDFAPFMALRDAPIGMNSHAIFTALDPSMPASLSPYIHEQVIRRAIGFEGLLLSDDMAMKAFDDPRYGSLGQAVARALEAGTDIALHCCGKMPEMKDAARFLPEIGAPALARWKSACARLGLSSEKRDFEGDLARLEAFLKE
ncbi:MAG: glycoside hydrolase family 3 protein [Alphaproteobacteria bacterium]|nr:glycoside hydrolase family 3 protein [Alphaproteobacteria bacterium]